MYEVAVIGTVLFMFFSAMDYVRRAWIRETNPVPTTWILMMVMMSLAFWMYWESPNKSWTANIGITSGIVNITIILTGVMATNIRDGTLTIAFDKVQRWCLGGGAAVVGFWYITKHPLLAYILVQCIALVGYIPTVKKLWRTERSSEPLLFWFAILFANLCAIFPALVKDDPFARIYLLRAVPSTILVIYLIARIQRKTSVT